MSFIEVEQVGHHYFTPSTVTTALEDVSFTIKKGEFVSFLGPSGCGKTTMLSILAGLITPTSGKIRIDQRHNRDNSTNSGPNQPACSQRGY